MRQLGRRLAGAGLGLLVLLTAPAASDAQGAPPATASFTLQGQVGHPRTVALPDLVALPPVSVTIARGHDGQKASYTGALLWTLVSAAAPAEQKDGRTHLQHTIVARGRDGYAVALAIAELDPYFEGKQVLVAYRQDGQPLAALRLVVPGDARPGRSIKDLVAVEVR